MRSTVKVAMEVLLQNSSAGEPGGLYLGNQRVVKVCRQPTKFYGKHGLWFSLLELVAGKQPRKRGRKVRRRWSVGSTAHVVRGKADCSWCSVAA